MGDKLLLNIGVSSHRQFIISHVELQNCHGMQRSLRLSVKRPDDFKNL